MANLPNLYRQLDFYPKEIFIKPSTKSLWYFLGNYLYNCDHALFHLHPFLIFFQKSAVSLLFFRGFISDHDQVVTAKLGSEHINLDIKYSLK